MCLVISVLMAVMSVNFYLNGFYVQAFITVAMAVGLIVFMIRGAGCRGGACKTKIEKEENSDN